MTHLDSVLVGVDGSAASSAAIRYAAREAQRLGAVVELVHMVPNYVPIAAMHPVAPADLAAAGREVLRNATMEAHELLDPEQVAASLQAGSRIPTLVELAGHAQLFVVGSRQRTMVDRLLTSSTLFGVAARASCPVVAVPEGWAPGNEQGRILVGVKSTSHFAGLARRALKIASERGAEVVLVHGWELPHEYDDMLTSHVVQHEWSDRARHSIEDGLRGLQTAYPDVPVDIQVLHGQPARVLQTASARADLLLVARRHRGFPIGHLGGTARALLRESHCPVEVVPPPDGPGEPDPAGEEARDLSE